MEIPIEHVEPVQRMLAMGFDRDRSVWILGHTRGNIDHAAALLTDPAYFPPNLETPQFAARMRPVPEVLRILEGHQRAIEAVVDTLALPGHAVPSLNEDDKLQVVQAFNEMIAGFNRSHYHRKYEAGLRDVTLATIKVSRKIPSYFANAKYGSVFSRKMLSMLGLRNLVLAGPQIFEDLKRTLFCSDPHRYPPGTGLEVMRMLTGNTVDLDSVVLRCDDPTMLDTINNM
eukprot:RCo025280